MGTRGPIPKRSDQRHGHRSKESTAAVTRLPGARKVPVPRSDPKWHPVAKAWYRSLARSGEAVWYEPSDWAMAALIAESISRDLLPQVVGTTEDGRILKATIPLKGASLSAYLRAMGVLLVTEGDRRRLQVELERPAERDHDAERAEAAVTEIRARLCRPAGVSDPDRSA